MSITFSAATLVPMVLGGEPVMVWDAIEGVEGLEINLANDNAAHVLGEIGVTGYIEEAEYLTAEDFLGRVLLAQGITAGDAGTETETTRIEGGALFVACGRAAGYTDERLAQLQELASFALDTPGAHITWA